MRKLSLESFFLDSLKQLVRGDLSDKSFLLGISGGSDSMCLANLFLKSGLKFGVIHINYSLRGSESVEDMNFVTTWAKNHDIECFVKVVDTPFILSNQGGNVQQMARDFRYSFFEETRLKYHFDFICTAHHASDWLETVIFNVLRGGFLKALIGIPDINGVILRPLLSFPKKEIIDYLIQNDISFRSDSSNNKLIYHRNLIRHEIIPVLRKINPSLLSTFLKNKRVWSELIQIKNEFVSSESKKLVTHLSDNEFLIDIDGLNECLAPITLLYEILIPLGFTSKMIYEIVEMKEKSMPIGSVFTHNDVKIIKLEKYLRLIKEIESPLFTNEMEITQNGNIEYAKGRRISVKNSRNIPENLNQGAEKIFVDIKKIIFPLYVRKWRYGDFFYPINMNNQRKKLQDYLTDKKIDKLNKEEVYLLVDANNQIIWVIGLRQDNRYKIDSNTEHILIFEHKIN
ncbi:MAG: tRNA lysidine(34) synthetase TilS [Bacteroidota bacterium]